MVTGPGHTDATCGRDELSGVFNRLDASKVTARRAGTAPSTDHRSAQRTEFYGNAPASAARGSSDQSQLTGKALIFCGKRHAFSVADERPGLGSAAEEDGYGNGILYLANGPFLRRLAAVRAPVGAAGLRVFPHLPLQSQDAEGRRTAHNKNLGQMLAHL